MMCQSTRESFLWLRSVTYDLAASFATMSEKEIDS